MMKSVTRVFPSLLVLVLAAGTAWGSSAGVLERRSGREGTALVYVSPEGRESAVGSGTASVSGERVVLEPSTGILFVAWDDGAAATREHRVSVSLDGGAAWSRPQTLTYDIPLKAGRLVPGSRLPELPSELVGGAGDRLFIVQFETAGLEAWRRMLRGLGAEVLGYLPEHAHIVRMDPALLPAVRALPFVRWVGPYEPGYRIEPFVLAEIAASTSCGPARRYHLVTFTRGPAEKGLLAADVRAAGGRVDLETPHGFMLDASLTLDQVVKISRSQHLLWIDRWSAPENDMDIVREQDGANYVESVAGYSGQGVSGEVMDCGFMQSHQDFDGARVHGPAAVSCDHGTCTYGIVFGNGNRDGDGDAKATSNLPSAQGWFYDYNNLADRYQETRELTESPIYAVFQSNSWGDARTTLYTSVSQQMDDIIWQYDVAIFQSQSNAGTQDSRPQAWAKNIISIGAVNHYDTQTLADDCWCSGASIGPAEDGTIKPDLAYWYDDIYSPDLEPGGYSTGLYTPTFGGTSAATPITAGIGGLFFEMWADNILGNAPPGTTVFEKRPHASTVKALMINTAEQYTFSGTGHDLTRMHQGWGLPSARRFYDRAALIQVVDESELLQEFDTHTYTATVPAGQGELKVTLAYTDLPGTTSATLHRINDVTVKVTDPSGGTSWWGNVGLDAGNWSAPGGANDTKNNIENVFIQNPASGAWTIEVTADDINQDQHVETPEVDQDYALVVYGADTLSVGCATPPPAPAGLTATPNGDNRIDLAWTGTATARKYRIYRALGGCSGTYVLIGTTLADGTTFSDTAANGGATYGYVVRAVEGCESPNSVCAAAMATGPCILAPAFGGLVSATGNDVASCGITLQWNAASPSCGGPAVYNVYRGSSPGFVPSPQSRVASCVAGTSWVDARGVASNQTYSYIVRAEDLAGRGSATCGGAPESNNVSKSAATHGLSGTVFSTGFETGLEGWTPSRGTPAATAGDFIAGAPAATTKNGQPAQPGSCAAGVQCLYTGTNKGGNADNGDVDGGEVVGTSPVFNASGYTTARLTLSRWHFNSAATADTGDLFALGVSNDDGATWANLERLGAMVSVNAWTAVVFDLEAYRPLTTQMRIRVRSADGPAQNDTVESAIDDVRVEGFQNCSAVVPASPGDTGTGPLRVDRDGTHLKLSWGSDCGGGSGFGIYRGDLFAGYATAAPLPGFCGVGTTSALVDPGADSYFFLVAPNDGTAEGSLGKRSDGSPRPQPASACYPRATPVDACAL